MLRMIYNPKWVKLEAFTARLQELNYLLPKFPRSYKFSKIPKEDLNEILLHNVLHRWSKQPLMISFYFESKTFRAALELFERM